jgi:hypothetical protein
MNNISIEYEAPPIDGSPMDEDEEEEDEEEVYIHYFKMKFKTK